MNQTDKQQDAKNDHTEQCATWSVHSYAGENAGEIE